MSTTTKKRGRPSKLPIPLYDAARMLEVSPAHLWQVLHGQKTSRPLRRRWLKLVEALAK